MWVGGSVGRCGRGARGTARARKAALREGSRERAGWERRREGKGGGGGDIELGLHAQDSSTSSIDCMRGSQRITGPDGEESLIIIISSPQTYPSRRLEPVRPAFVRLMKRV